MPFQPRAVQVMEFASSEQVDPSGGFEEVEGYTTTAAAASGWAADGRDDGEEWQQGCGRLPLDLAGAPARLPHHGPPAGEMFGETVRLTAWQGSIAPADGW
jgi:hypothetical protein